MFYSPSLLENLSKYAFKEIFIELLLIMCWFFSFPNANLCKQIYILLSFSLLVPLISHPRTQPAWGMHQFLRDQLLLPYLHSFFLCLTGTDYSLILWLSLHCLISQILHSFTLNYFLWIWTASPQSSTFTWVIVCYHI